MVIRNKKLKIVGKSMSSQSLEGFKRFPKSKLSQQEILGFIVIVMVVVIVGVIFLGISLRKDRVDNGRSTEDAEIANFLSASSKYTTDCMIREPVYADISDILSGCDAGKICSDDRDTCEVLDQIYADLMTKLWAAGADRPIKYTKLSAYYKASDDSGANMLIDEIEQGNSDECSTQRAGRYTQYKYPGEIIVELQTCS
jgi:hypothetical protein